MRRLSLLLLAVVLVLPLAPAGAGHTESDSDFAIVNGSAVPPNTYPWMAAVGSFSGANITQFCGSSLIAPNWILTAAHCLRDGRNQPTTTAADLQFVVNTTNWTTGGEVLQAANIVVHPNYNPATTDNDIALIQLTANSTVAPVRFARAADAPLNNPPTTARVIGYGAVGTNQAGSEQMLQVDVPVQADATCAGGYGQYNATTQLCAGSPTQDANNPGNDSCQGDSGGPLFVEQAGGPVQIGVVSYGGICGVGSPGVYTEITTYEAWIDQTLGNPPPQGQAGPPDPGPGGNQPEGAAAQPNRIAGADPVSAVDNAEAISQLVFREQVAFGVLATSANFPDALGGSALASYFGPLLYVNAQGQLEPDTLAEFGRVVQAGGTIYVLGGTAAIPATVDQQLQGAGFVVARLAGEGRQQTARLVAEQVRNVVNQPDTVPPFNAMILAFEGNWPDAVAVGSISAWFGIPVLLTPTNELGGPALEYIQTYQPDFVYVLGGPAVISENVRNQVVQAQPNTELVELGGATRLETGAQIAAQTRFEYQFNTDEFDFVGEPITTPTTIIAVNLRQEGAFTHVLAASTMAGQFGGVFAPLEGDGTTVDQSVLDSICGLNAEVFAIGGPTLVNDSVYAPLQAASAGQGCAQG